MTGRRNASPNGMQIPQECGSYLERFVRVPRTFRACWYCVQTYPTKELLTNAHLRFQGFDTFLPTELRLAKKRRPRVVAFFPGYLFVSFDIGQSGWQSVLSTYGVKRLLGGAPDEPMSVDPATFETLRHVAEPPRSGLARIPDGAIVRVLDGPLAGQKFTVQRSTAERIVLLCRIMQREVRVEFDRTSVEEVSNP